MILLKKQAGSLKRLNGGFTLIELSVVVFLIGLILLIAVPKIRDTILYDDLERTASYIKNHARLLRNDAVREQVDYLFHINIDGNSLWTQSADMTPEAIDESKKEALILPEDIDILDIYPLGSRDKITMGEFIIRFSRKDYTYPTVLHLGSKDKKMTLVFEPFINRVSTYDRYVDFDEEYRTIAKERD